MQYFYILYRLVYRKNRVRIAMHIDITFINVEIIDLIMHEFAR